jgi:hypothetical protein
MLLLMLAKRSDLASAQRFERRMRRNPADRPDGFRVYIACIHLSAANHDDLSRHKAATVARATKTIARNCDGAGFSFLSVEKLRTPRQMKSRSFPASDSATIQ